MSLVAEVNGATLAADAGLKAALERTDELSRIGLERHGAIRVAALRTSFRRCAASSP